MDFLKDHILSIVTFLPLAGALMLLLLPKNEHGLLRVTALSTSLLGLLAALPLWSMYDPVEGGIQLRETASWVPWAGISYDVGVDGIAVVFILLTSCLVPIALLSSWSSITHRVKEFMVGLLVLQTAMIGVFVSLDLVLFYVFWELMLVPMYFIIGIWGHERRIQAAVKLFVISAAGSLLMLAAILYLHWKTRAIGGGPTFAYEAMLSLSLSPGEQAWLFGAFVLSFAIKTPLFPLHTWMPDAYVQAPSAGTVLFASVKLGTFGFVRYAIPLFPEAFETYAPLIGWLAVIGIVYGSLVSMAQKDMKKLIAYSSLAHLGFVVMGLMARTEEALTGAVVQMVNLGITTSALFLLVGYMSERRQSRTISDFGGQAKVTPLMAVFFLVATLSAIGLPGTNGFVGEFLILSGTFVSESAWGRWWSVLATSGVILGAVYMLTLFQKTFLGPITSPEVAQTKDLNAREFTTLAPLLVMIVLLGVYPQPLIEMVKKPVVALVEKPQAPVRGTQVPVPPSIRERFKILKEINPRVRQPVLPRNGK